jgi:hypothetical protein
MLELEYINTSDSAIDHSRLLFGDCTYKGEPLEVLDAAGRRLAYFGVFTDHPPGYSHPAMGRWLCPGARVRIRGVDITDFYDFPRTAQKLTFRYLDSLGDRIGARATVAALDFRPTNRQPKGGKLEQGSAPIEKVDGAETVLCHP